MQKGEQLDSRVRKLAVLLRYQKQHVFCCFFFNFVVGGELFCYFFKPKALYDCNLQYNCQLYVTC